MLRGSLRFISPALADFMDRQYRNTTSSALEWTLQLTTRWKQVMTWLRLGPRRIEERAKEKNEDFVHPPFCCCSSRSSTSPPSRIQQNSLLQMNVNSSKPENVRIQFKSGAVEVTHKYSETAFLTIKLEDTVMNISGRMWSFILLWSAFPVFVSAAFSPSARITASDSMKGSKTQLCSVENWISGLTNSPPSKALLTNELEESLTRETSLQGKKLACVYKASKDGWSAVNFHSSVDGKGSALVVALPRSGKIFGGFNPLGWRSTDDYYQSNAAFLWFVAGGGKVTKCSILPGGNAAVFDYATAGPCFGAADLLIGEPKAAVMGGFAGPDMMDTTINSGSLRSGRSSVGGSYDFAQGWPVRGDFQLVELEVYCNEAISDFASSGSVPNWWPF